MIDHAAADFAGQFYSYVQRGLERGPVPVAEALRHARRRFYDTGDPTFLAYAFYGDVNLQFVAE